MDSLLEVTGLSANFWGSLGGLIALVCVVVAIMSGQSEAANNPSPQPAKDWDLFKLGEIYDEPCPVEVIDSPPKPKTKSKKSTPKPDPMDDEIKRLKRELQIQTLQNKLETANQRRKALLKRRAVTTTKKAATKERVEHPLFADCLATLEALGHKKGDVRNIVHECLTKHNPSTVEEFINIFYSKVS